MISGFLKRFRNGCPIFRVFSVDNLNRIIDILTWIKGEGCRIDKPVNAEGRNWRIIFDGRQSDSPESGGASGGVEPFPLDYHVRYVNGEPVQSQYGDFHAQTDFTFSSAITAQYLASGGVPEGLRYLRFGTGEAAISTSAGSEGVSTGVGIKAQSRTNTRLARLAHGNQYAGHMRRGDGNSVELDMDNYAAGPAYILRKWNDDSNPLSLSQSAVEAGNVQLMHYDTWLDTGETRFDRPAEIRFAATNSAMLEDLMVRITDYVNTTILARLCPIVTDVCETWRYHARCKNYNQDHIPYAGTPGIPHGGWTCLDSLDDMADGDALAQLLADVQALYARVTATPIADVESRLASAGPLPTAVDAQYDAVSGYGLEVSSLIQTLDGVYNVTIRNIDTTLTRLEAEASDQERRVAALMGRT